MQEVTLMNIFIGVCGIQLLYWFYYLIGLIKQKTNHKNLDSEPISIIVAANNELDNLKKLIPKLLEQDHNQYEIIIVNDRSTDGTVEYLYELKDVVSNLKVVTIDILPDHINGKKYALTLAIKAASYENVLLTDADCIPENNSWVSSMANGFYGDKKIVLGFSQYENRSGLLNAFIRFETLITGMLYTASANMGSPFMGVGRNMAYKKSIFIDNKGFSGYNDVIGGDDDLFINKHATGANTSVVVGIPSLITSQPKTTFASYFQQKKRHLAIGKYYRSKNKIILGGFSLTWIMTLGLALALGFTTPLESFIVELQIPIIMFSARVGLMLVALLLAALRFGVKFNPLGLLFFDIFYVIYYIFVGTTALFAKNIRWR